MAKKSAAEKAEKTTKEVAAPAKKEKVATSKKETVAKAIPVTVATLKAQIDSEGMGIKYTSKSKKAELETAIAEWRKGKTKPVAKAGTRFKGEH